MASETAGISKTTLTLTLFSVNGGSTTQPIHHRAFKLTFNTVSLPVEFINHLEPFSLQLTFSQQSWSKSAVSKIIPASLTLITSRTSPFEPQPVAALPRREATGSYL